MCACKDGFISFRSFVPILVLCRLSRVPSGCYAGLKGLYRGSIRVWGFGGSRFRVLAMGILVLGV